LRNHPQFKAYAALVCVCFFWGTTYLGIRIALESFSPVTLMALRFSLSGALILLAAKAMGAPLPDGRELRESAVYGVLVLGIGNGCLAFAEQWIPSGLAALFITTGPFWMVGMEALVPGGQRLHPPTIAGMLIGLAGVAFLLSREGFGSIHGAILAGFFTLQLGCAGWSLGSILQRRQGGIAHPIVSGGVQQLATGLMFLLPAIFLPSHAASWNWRGVMAVLYLVTFGSLVGYSAYIYAMSQLPVAVVSIYNYINPIVAVALGWIFYREPFGPRELVAMCIIFTGVFMVKTATARRR
jgi:drug/metabolite transporter (DMT)-like permease